MNCDVCGCAATRQDITGALCEEHQDALRSAYFSFLDAGGEPYLFRTSEQKAQAIELVES